jgi:RNA polymerase sigma-70 factor (ECF subfamily)
LSDVVGWSAAETARALETSVPAVNSALQRARETLRKKLPANAPARRDIATEREVLASYMKAWEARDMAALAALLKHDAIFSMPPRMEWYQGRDQIHEFLNWATAQTGFTEVRTVPTRANGQPAIGYYGFRGGAWHQHAIHVLTIEDREIALVHNFMDEKLFTLFPELQEP